jgi:hypothetical protein
LGRLLVLDLRIHEDGKVELNHARPVDPAA